MEDADRSACWCCARREKTSSGGTGEQVAAELAVEWLRALAETWGNAYVPQVRADVLHVIYDRIVARVRRIVSVRLTPSAYAHGLALALPEKVELARPTGVGRGITTYEIPIESRDEWLAAAGLGA